MRWIDIQIEKACITYFLKLFTIKWTPYQKNTKLNDSH